MKREENFIVSVYNDHDILLKAVKKIRSQGIKIDEVFSPYPVHGLEHALGYKRSWMPQVAFMFGLLGCSLAILMQTLMMEVDWPMIVGGKPYISIPDFVPVTFESTVLLAAFGMTFTFFGIQGMSPLTVPKVFDRRGTDDKHIMAINKAKNKLDDTQIKKILYETEAEEIYEKDFTEEDSKMNFGTYVINLFTHGVTSSSRKL